MSLWSPAEHSLSIKTRGEYLAFLTCAVVLCGPRFNHSVIKVSTFTNVQLQMLFAKGGLTDVNFNQKRRSE